jgi:hypothetical protein
MLLRAANQNFFAQRVQLVTSGTEGQGGGEAGGGAGAAAAGGGGGGPGSAALASARVLEALHLFFYCILVSRQLPTRVACPPKPSCASLVVVLLTLAAACVLTWKDDLQVSAADVLTCSAAPLALCVPQVIFGLMLLPFIDLYMV